MRVKTTNRTVRLAGLGAAAAFALTGLAVPGAANAASGDAEKVQDTTVVVWMDYVNVRDEPELGDNVDYVAHKGDRLDGDCWEYGQSVTDHGITNNIWIQTGNVFDDEYVWAGALEGNERANLPIEDEC